MESLRFLKVLSLSTILSLSSFFVSQPAFGVLSKPDKQVCVLEIKDRGFVDSEEGMGINVGVFQIQVGGIIQMQVFAEDILLDPYGRKIIPRYKIIDKGVDSQGFWIDLKVLPPFSSKIPVRRGYCIDTSDVRFR